MEGGDVYLTEDGLSRGTSVELRSDCQGLSRWTTGVRPRCVRNGICCRRVYIVVANSEKCLLYAWEHDRLDDQNSFLDNTYHSTWFTVRPVARYAPLGPGKEMKSLHHGKCGFLLTGLNKYNFKSPLCLQQPIVQMQTTLGW